MKKLEDELISIVVPTYNRSNMLSRTLDSLLNQSYSNIEIIVVDDNHRESQERVETEKVIEKYSHIKNIVYMKNEHNVGACESRNNGIKKARGRYITFLDDDDEYRKDKIEIQYRFYKNNFLNDEGFINCDLDVYYKEKYLRTHKTRISQKNILFETLNEKILGTPTFFFPKKILQDVGGFEKLPKGQEWYLILKLILKNYKFKNIPKSLVKVHDHEGPGISNAGFDSKKMLAGLNNIYQIQEKHFDNLSDRQKKIIQSRYFLKCALIYSDIFDQENTFKNLKNALNCKVINIDNLKYVVRILFLTKKNEKLLKKIISKIKVEKQ